MSGPRALGSTAATAPRPRRSVVRDAIGVGVATGAYGISFGAIAVAAKLSIVQTMVLSLLLFSGASQFALVGVLAAGGGAAPAVTTAVLLGARNAFYGLRLSTLLRLRGVRRFAAAQLVIDESTAMALAQPTEETSRLGFWATGLSVFLLWNLGTLAGGLSAHLLTDPRRLGLDAAVPAAFVALLAPRMRARPAWAIAVPAALVALLLTPVTPPGVPVLAAAATAVLLASARRGSA